jgi:hypothetical protein
MGAPPSENPRVYWTPTFGMYSVGPDTIGLLTPGQMYSTARSARQA